ncbi:MAG: Mth938-like domain-containing protein [Gallionella sp.]|nr:Mth938-like domain-containing protein [Gallionella sp.]
MKLQLSRLGNIKIFTGHGDDHVMVNYQRYDHSVVVQAGDVHTDWSVAEFDSLSEASFEYFIRLQPELVLLGTGARQRFAHPRLYRALTNAGIAVEFMDTKAACRTYNILVADDRRVIAAILFEAESSPKV